MRVALLSLNFPPESTEGIPRQRAELATALAASGVDVHVVTLGRFTRTYIQTGYTVHSIASTTDTVYSPSSTSLNHRLTQSQQLYEVVTAIENSGEAFDVIDSPLWGLQAYVTALYAQSPVVVWLQTTQAQLLQLNNRKPDRWERVHLDLERICLSRSRAWLAHSRSILAEVTASYHLDPPDLSQTVHLGLADAPGTTKSPSKQVTAVVVGRLEKRKGTPLLFRALPGLLAQNPGLKVNFIGADNSESDGWFADTGHSYVDYWRLTHPDVADRVVFAGRVSDDELMRAYGQADLVLAPSLYESFGLVYVEAMRASLPVVGINTGAASEIFPRGELDGAVLLDEPDEEKLVVAVSDLIANAERRRRIGNAGRRLFEADYRAERMASETLRFYERVSKTGQHHRSTRSQPIYQVMEALDVGDAVSTITRTNAQILEELGQPRRILALHHHPTLGTEIQAPGVLFEEPQVHAIYHYWGYSQLIWLAKYHKGNKALYYHNITPWTFFEPTSPAYESTQSGYRQLAQIVNDFDLLIGDSVFNLLELAPYLRERKPALCVYPTIEVDWIKSQPVDDTLRQQLRAEGNVNFLMVGRIARNKRQDRVIEVFDYYWRNINRHAHLWLVGGCTSDPGYRGELDDLLAHLPSRGNIHFSGKVPDQAIAAYYLAADVFICASEHEGFCMPLIEAMAYDIPVFAWAAAAVPETMGAGGVLIREWDVARIAELINVVLKDSDLKQSILQKQAPNLGRFTRHEARKRLQVAVDFLNGNITHDSLMFTIEPGNR